MHTTDSRLHHLAGLYGVKTSYLDMNHRVQPASNDSLLAVLKALGAPIESIDDVADAAREKQIAHWRQPVEPVIVVWGKEMLTVDLRLPESMLKIPISAVLSLESGDERHLVWRADESQALDSHIINRTRFISTRLYLPESLPAGYHHLKLTLDGRTSDSLIIAAPLRAYIPPLEKEKIWGAFLPLYSLRNRNNWGAGDYSTLGDFMAWVSGLGGSLVGTLPILPSFFDEKFGPGPYMPASRLFWNEFYLDIEQIPELADCREAQDLINSPAFQKDLALLRRSSRVNYHDILAQKRSILEALSESFFASKSERLAQFKRYVKMNDKLADYARFRAAGEQHGICWQDWPQRLRSGNLRKGDYDEKCEQYHLYAQWLAHEQLAALSEKARQTDTYLYLDVPVGVHPYSYDVWRERDSFVTAINAGAPPDPVFTSGQNWCFPPLHPEGIRRQGYRYFIQSLRHQMSQAGMLRIDHMMNFHRLFWIPKEMENRDGVYVGYRADEMYAILCLESARNKTVIIGEDLGIVPPEVRPMMEKHGIFRMFVGQYELIAENQLGMVPTRAVASLNTHDMFPFTAFWEELDIAERQKLKLIDAEMARKELEQRREIKRALISILQYRGINNEISQDAQATLKAVISLMATSPAYALLVNMEDLWQETHPQNVPGTLRKQNWTQKARCTFEQFTSSPLILEILKSIDRERRGAASL